MSATRLPSLILALLALALAASGPAVATTYQMISDQALADQAAVVAEVRVVGVESSPVDGPPATDYAVDLQRLVKGHLPGSTVVVRVPGGVRPDGVGLKIFGAPEFAEGEEALLFLRPAPDGTYRILHLMLGAFHRRQVGGRDVAVRDLSEAFEVGPDGLEARRDLARDFSGFAEWLADRAAGVPRERDYVLDASAQELQQAVEPYSYMTSKSGHPIRWFRFDSGQSVPWKVHASGQPGLGPEATVQAFKAAMEAWNADAESDVQYTYTGTTTAGGGLHNDDGVNAILFEDPRKSEADGTFACGSGGVIAVGGPFFYTTTRNWGGKAWHEAVEADIVTNDGTECYFRNNPRVAEEVFAHELGHTLGISHSSTNDALMFANIHNDGRGARLHGDDKAAVASLYPAADGGGGTSPSPHVPAAPSGLTAQAASATEAALSWEDHSEDETGFRVESKVRGGTFREVLSLPAGAVSALVGGLKPGTEHVFRVRAAGASGYSAYSNTARTRTPLGTTSPLAAPSDLRAVPRPGGEIYLTWKDNSGAETGFRVERAAAGGDFAEVGSLPAGATGALVRGLSAGASYSFRVRAAGSGGFSGYSNVGSAAAQGGGSSSCSGGETLCLQGSRFQAQVLWRNAADGAVGRGRAVPRTEASGTFWFFGQENVELIVKVLDGRGVNGRFWVFAGALTDLEYWLQVTDTETGAVQVYHNRPGDTRGFADTSFPTAGSPAQVLEAKEIALLAPKKAPLVDSFGTAAGACAADSDTLCLLDGRYKVEVTWKTATGSGTGGAVPDSDNTGFFWFFGPENLELVVKVLDGTAVNGKVWVFYGAISDVDYTVRVTDTVTGQVKSYRNQPGSLTGAADTSAL